MPSFIAPCPRGHMGNFVTHDGYHHCFCGLHIPVFDIPENAFLKLGTEEQDKLMEQYIQEGIAERVEEAITDAETKVERDLLGQIEEQSARLLMLDPEWKL